MVAQAFRDVDTRHRLLEGFLQRLALHPDADAFVLRGGMLVRHWFSETERSTNDIDLVCRLPYEVQDMRVRIAQILGEQKVHDGVRFEPERFRLDVLRPSCAHPGMRLFAAGQVESWSAEMSVDFTFRLNVWPIAQRSVLRTSCAEAFVWTCQPEMLIGRKLQVTAELGRRHWRPKDLGDIWLMLQRSPTQVAVLGEAVERSFEGELAQCSFDELFKHQSWWQERHSQARWQRYARNTTLPTDLSSVVDQVDSLLAPITGTNT